MANKVVRIWTDVEVDANTEEGAMLAAAAKAIQDGGETIQWQFQVLLSPEEFEAMMSELETISREGAEQETMNENDEEPATPTA